MCVLMERSVALSLGGRMLCRRLVSDRLRNLSMGIFSVLYIFDWNCGRIFRKN